MNDEWFTFNVLIRTLLLGAVFFAMGMMFEKAEPKRFDKARALRYFKDRFSPAATEENKTRKKDGGE